MKLERLVLENFRQYFGRQRIEFSKDSHKNVTVVNGDNGTGKTSMFLAINWCLYGDEAFKRKNNEVDNVGQLISKEALRQADPNLPLRTAVELTFSHEGRRYILRRALNFVGRLDAFTPLVANPEFVMKQIRPNGESVTVENPVSTLNAILPANVRTYFFFDGEKIDDFAKPEAASEVKEAIYLIMRLEVLDRSRIHLKEIAKEYRRELQSISTDKKLQSLIGDRIKKEEQLDTDSRRRDELKREVEVARNHISDIDRELRDMQSVKDLQEQRERAETELKSLNNSLEESVGELRNLVADGYFVFARPAFARALAIMDDKRARGEIPSNIRRQLVHDLLEQLVCICGRPFAEHGTEYQRLLGLLENTVPGSIEDDVLALVAILRNFDSLIEKQHFDFAREMRRQVELRTTIKATEDRIGDLELQLKDSPLENVSDLEHKRQAYRSNVESYNLDLGILKERIDSGNVEIAKLDEQIKQARKESSKAKLIGKKLELAQQSAEAIDQMYQAFAEDMRKQIESKTREIFRALVWKDEHFQDVRLSPEYHLEVFDRYGTASRPELSAGERQVLSLSFITAIAEVSGNEAPLVMDTPFGRLSSQHRENITMSLPKLCDQLVLFVTDEELRDQARWNLQSYIGAEYRLNFDDVTGCTEITEGR